MALLVRHIRKTTPNTKTPKPVHIPGNSWKSDQQLRQSSENPSTMAPLKHQKPNHGVAAATQMLGLAQAKATQHHTPTAEQKARASKPAMERRRRERINRSLDELKSILIESLRKDSTCHSKLEKADILEMTVQFIKMQKSGNAAQNGSSSAAFASGYNAAKAQLGRYFATPQGATVPEPYKAGIMAQMNQGMQAAAPPTVQPQQPRPAVQNQAVENMQKLYAAQQNLARINAQLAASQQAGIQQNQMIFAGQMPSIPSVAAAPAIPTQISPIQNRLPTVQTPQPLPRLPSAVTQRVPHFQNGFGVSGPTSGFLPGQIQNVGVPMNSGPKQSSPVLQSLIQSNGQPVVQHVRPVGMERQGLVKSGSSSGLSLGSSLGGEFLVQERSGMSDRSMSPVSVGSGKGGDCWRPW